MAFERDLNDAETSRIAVVGANGQNEHSLDLGCVDPCAGDLTPTWFKSGDRIAFTPVVGSFDRPGESARSAVLRSADLDRL